MPLHSDFYWIETAVNDVMGYMGAIISCRFRDTLFEYWLLEREGQNRTFFFVLLLGSLIWFTLLDCSIRRRSKLVALEAASRVVEADADLTAIETVQASAPSQNDDIAATPATGETPLMMKLAPPGHRPINAHLNMSPFHLARNLSKPPVLSASNPFLVHPQGRNSSGFFDPNVAPSRFGDSSEAREELDRNSSPSFQGRNFATMKETAPVSYKTLREQGLLDEDGDLMGKFRLHQLLSEESS
jgi:hypothetical protein